jgi:hypothetical protein
MDRKLLEKIYQEENEEARKRRERGGDGIGDRYIPLPKSKEEIYKESEDNTISPIDYLVEGPNYPLKRKLQEQIESQYYLPKSDESGYEYWAGDILDQLSENLGIKNTKIDPTSSSYTGAGTEPQYLYKGKKYGIKELPKQSNPNSLTSFLGSFDPFQTKINLSPEERKNAPIIYEPRGIYGSREDDALVNALINLGYIKDFQTERAPTRENLEEKDPRMKISGDLRMNPITLDEIIEAPIAERTRFNKLYKKLKK